MPEEERLEEPTEPTEPEPEPPEKPEGEHDAVPPGGKCSVCGWEFGKSIEPHAVYFGPARQEPSGPPPPKVPVKPSDPAACAPVALQGTCPKCGWTAGDERAHPVIL